MDDPDTKTNLTDVLKQIEERLAQYKDVPEELRQLRILQKQLHEALQAKEEQEAARQKVKEEQELARQNAIYRLLKEAQALLFPNNGQHK